jgi:hypothetical protein
MATVPSAEVFAHVAPRMRFDGQTLTLVELAPSTIVMTRPLELPGDAPQLSYLPTGAFLDRWAEQAREVGPPGCRMRGTLSLLDPDAQVAGRSVVELRSPRLAVDGLAYDVEVLEGIVPTSSGACVLFLEWGDAPVAGTAPPTPGGRPREPA